MISFFDHLFGPALYVQSFDNKSVCKNSSNILSRSLAISFIVDLNKDVRMRCLLRSSRRSVDVSGNPDKCTSGPRKNETERFSEEKGIISMRRSYSYQCCTWRKLYFILTGSYPVYV